MLDEKTVVASEPVDRFVFKNHVRTDGSLKRGAFDVPKSGKLSVYRTDGCSNTELWTIYENHVEPSRRDSVGTARVLAEVFYAEGLSIDPNGVPHHRHANVEGWPLGADQKDMLKDLKQALAEKAALFSRP